MTNYIKRFVYVGSDEHSKINPLIWPFLLATTLYGLGFMLLGDWTGVSSSSLFGAMYDLHNFLPTLWGLVASLAGAAAVTIIARRSGWWGELAALLGFSVWLFAFFVYLLQGFWLVLLTVALPNLYFWTWWYFRVKWYERQKKAGIIIDP